MDIGLLILRSIVGLTLAAHGAQKLFGWFGGGGIAGTAPFFAKMGFRPAKLQAVLAGLGETGGGLALALGALTPAAAAVLVATMLVAVTTHLGNGFFAMKGGIEYPLVLGGAAAAIGFAGPGSLSFDGLLHLPLAGATWGAAALAAGFLGGAVTLASRAPVEAPQTH